MCVNPNHHLAQMREPANLAGRKMDPLFGSILLCPSAHGIGAEGRHSQ